MHCLSSWIFLSNFLLCEFAFLRKYPQSFRINLSNGQILEYLTAECCLHVKNAFILLAFANIQHPSHTPGFRQQPKSPATYQEQPTIKNRNRICGSCHSLNPYGTLYTILLRNLLRHRKLHLRINQHLHRKILLHRFRLLRMQHLPL